MAVLHYPTFGGPHNQFLQLDKAFARAGVELTIALTDEPGTAADRLREADANVVTLPLGRLRASANPRWLLRFAQGFSTDLSGLRDVITSHNIDTVIVSGLVNPQGALAAAPLGLPIIWQIIDTRTPAPLVPIFMRVARRYASAFMFWGEELNRKHARRCPLAQPVEIFGPAVDIDAFADGSQRGSAIRDSLGIPRTDPVIGTLANVNPQKGIEYFGRAAIRIYQRHPDAWFVVVGATYPHFAAYAQRIRAEMQHGGIPPNRILFPGNTDDPAAWLGAFDVKLITSVPHSEGIPTTLVEAMAAGVPVVCADVGAIREAAIDEKTGRVVPPRDSAAIADAVCQILNDRPLAETMSATARDWIKGRFSVEACLSSHLRAIHAAQAYAKLHPHKLRASLTDEK